MSHVFTFGKQHTTQGLYTIDFVILGAILVSKTAFRASQRTRYLFEKPITVDGFVTARVCPTISIFRWDGPAYTAHISVASNPVARRAANAAHRRIPSPALMGGAAVGTGPVPTSTPSPPPPHVQQQYPFQTQAGANSLPTQGTQWGQPQPPSDPALLAHTNAIHGAQLHNHGQATYTPYPTNPYQVMNAHLPGSPATPPPASSAAFLPQTSSIPSLPLTVPPPTSAPPPITSTSLPIKTPPPVSPASTSAPLAPVPTASPEPAASSSPPPVAVVDEQAERVVRAMEKLLGEAEKAAVGDAPSVKIVTDASRRVRNALYSKLRRRVLSQPVLDALGKMVEVLDPSTVDPSSPTGPATAAAIHPLVPPLMTAALSHSREGDDNHGVRLQQKRQVQDGLMDDEGLLRVLIVCPNAVLFNWKDEFDRRANFTVDIFHGAKKESALSNIKSGTSEVLITSFDTLKGAFDDLNSMHWAVVIADEVMAEGRDYSKIDGTFPAERRLAICNEFNTDVNKFILLISTTAGGVGLNLAGASVDVVMDPNFNPALDLQAQDRAFRIGETRNVTFLRLISAGTIEEMIYNREIYKQQHSNIAYDAATERRLFEGVQGDSNLLSYLTDHHMTKTIVQNTEKAEAEYAATNDDFNDAPAEQMGTLEDTYVSGFFATDGGSPHVTNGVKKAEREKEKANRDAINAILYQFDTETHQHSNVLGESTLEVNIPRNALEAMAQGTADEHLPAPHSRASMGASYYLHPLTALSATSALALRLCLGSPRGKDYGPPHLGYGLRMEVTPRIVRTNTGLVEVAAGRDWLLRGR
ncbi:hypothetical protein M427DRAFT_66908 [Gonapodya prolifera JEL478]|uniref:Helicase C-terminal domain-containing protein n=1 Tax=Gonapodya prolifera (strain JEL478) TaxID=1344416 RepID=A0A139AST9_GONPJ|nr:hypothetical protein M427DRAFT_66908 [Gonapodya prolifera JEL478]|eukprot:KXS19779.1 hypothetical protein M427DRAFT_66908 [Gonapodya prolifera JEL478]